MTDVTELADRYIEVWNETDGDRRRALIAKTWGEDGAYADPAAVSNGHDGIDKMTAAVHERFPGARFQRTSAVDKHNDRIRFGWELVAADGNTIVAGVDFGTVAADGRLASITGFFGELAEAA
ncbi:nuclear transport factor 2 family protein [Parvibaculum sp.]|uniref:nuclear transport factor 2 family protein n=1 Tax=Parvibaculum sp. TaxID=2024848 RepID=UPI0034A04BB2